MKGYADLSSEKLSQEPIAIPGSPFWNVFKRFGRDELIAMIINVFGTTIMALFSANVLLLSIIGPLVEKIGFFPAHFRDAWKVYKTTRRKRRKSFFFYFKKAVRGGMTSLIEDILIHDPIYILLLFIGLKVYAGSPVWLLSAASFVIAVIVVAGAEVGFTEFRFWNFKRKMKRKGFGFESYYESRFFISKERDPKEVIDLLAKTFNLKFFKTLTYNDYYLDNRLPHYSDRLPKIRIRSRTSERNKGMMRTTQIVFTRAAEISGEKLEQHRFFPARKEKLYYFLKKNEVGDINLVKNSKIKNALKSFVIKSEKQHVKFTRMFVNSKDLLVSADKVQARKPFYVLEIKSHKNKKLLIEVMRFVMRELPVMQTTYGKADLVRD